MAAPVPGIGRRPRVAEQNAFAVLRRAEHHGAVGADRHQDAPLREGRKELPGAAMPRENVAQGGVPDAHSLNDRDWTMANQANPQY
ncbi:hypothetical protein GCM10027612_77550 [Microbispora bryophytorum subsp. camponoti]